jgi:aromatic ring-opening dioxygenase catalytic subunit (LigB family)
MASWLRAFPASLPARPAAILVVSAHWEERVPTVQAATSPPLLFDYYGFPAHTYALTWPASGSPALARRTQALLAATGIASARDDRRGFDHGAFVPLKVAFPAADVPTIQLSLRADLDPAAHLAIGRALAPLRDEGVLIVGAGMSFHNTRTFMTARAGPDSAAFDAWLVATVEGEAALRDERLARWTSAPAARAAHPREEHLLPLMVASGSAPGDAGRRVFRDEVLGAVVSAIQFG